MKPSKQLKSKQRKRNEPLRAKQQPNLPNLKPHQRQPKRHYQVRELEPHIKAKNTLNQVTQAIRSFTKFISIK